MNEDTAYLNIFVDLFKSMVAHPEDVKMTVSTDARGILVTMDVNPEDRGKVIGAAGITAKAIRSIARVIGAAHEAHIGVLIVG